MGNSDVTTHKFTAILSKKVDTGKIMNALAHMSIGLVASNLDKIPEMNFGNYVDKDGGIHKSLSNNSFVILRADNSNQIRTIRNKAIEKGIAYVDFTNTMQEGTYIEQIERTKQTPEAELEYYGVCLFGKIEDINELNKKFSLWR